MNQHKFGQTKRNVPVIGQGTWYIDDADRSTAIAALRKGLDLGMTHIDTAEMYGRAEEVVAEALSGRRDEVFLVSKILPQHASRQGTIAACEKSLLRLKTDRLDCYLLHWRGRYRLEDTVDAFEQLCRTGKILSWGVSNFDVGDLEEIWAIGSRTRPVCNQVLYNLTERAIEHRVLPWCENHDVAVVAYSPFGHGQFPGSNISGGRVLQAIAKAHGATARQVALTFLVRRRSLFAIPKASTPEHTVENAAAAGFRLSEAELIQIEEAFPRGVRPHHLPML